MAVLAVVGVVVGVVVLATRDGGGRSPEDTARQFFAAFRDQDCEALFSLVSESTLADVGSTVGEEVAECEAAVASGDPGDLSQGATLESVTLKSEHDDLASVEVTYTDLGETTTSEFDLVREDDQWMVDLTALN